jgi:hypothetical protein
MPCQAAAGGAVPSSLIRLNANIALHPSMVALTLTANARSKAATLLRLYWSLQDHQPSQTSE